MSVIYAFAYFRVDVHGKENSGLLEKVSYKFFSACLVSN